MVKGAKDAGRAEEGTAAVASLRAERVARLKEQVRTGRYEIDVRNLAEKLFDAGWNGAQQASPCGGACGTCGATDCGCAGAERAGD